MPNEQPVKQVIFGESVIHQCPSEWGRPKEGDKWKVVWTKIHSVSKCCRELTANVRQCVVEGASVLRMNYALLRSAIVHVRLNHQMSNNSRLGGGASMEKILLQ